MVVVPLQVIKIMLELSQWFICLNTRVFIGAKEDYINRTSKNVASKQFNKLNLGSLSYL